MDRACAADVANSALKPIAKLAKMRLRLRPVETAQKFTFTKVLTSTTVDGRTAFRRLWRAFVIFVAAKAWPNFADGACAVIRSTRKGFILAVLLAVAVGSDGALWAARQTATFALEPTSAPQNTASGSSASDAGQQPDNGGPVLKRKQHPEDSEPTPDRQQAPAAQTVPAAQPSPAGQSSAPNVAPTLKHPDEQPSATSAPDGSGPDGDADGIVVPRLKRKAEDESPPPPAPVVRNPPGLSNLTLQVEVPEVTVDIGVLLQKTHQFIPNLKASNFVVYEDGEPQKIIRFKRVEAPITALILAEFASTNYQFIYDMRNAAWAFAQQLRPQDYVALMTYDMRTQIVTDFTQDKNQLLEGISDLTIPGFTERDLFDALYEALDRMTRIEGQKYILLVSSGRDTFSRITLDKILRKIRETPNVTIYSISTGGFLRAMVEGSPRLARSDINYLQADNQMQTFAHMTGGMFFAPRFEGELPDDVRAINEAIRSKYEIVYHPTNSKQDGTYRKIQVELVDDEGRPMQFQDQKHHPLKYDLIYRSGYRAQQQVE